MENENHQEQTLEDRYCAMLKGYYERLKDERKSSSSKPAIEEVKLRLFLSLLDRPDTSSSTESASASL